MFSAPTGLPHAAALFESDLTGCFELTIVGRCRQCDCSTMAFGVDGRWAVATDGQQKNRLCGARIMGLGAIAPFVLIQRCIAVPIGSTLRFGTVCCDSCSSTDGARTPVHARALRLAPASGQRFVRAFHAANCDIRNPQTQKLSSHSPLCAGSPKRASNGECTHVRRLRDAGIQHPHFITQPCRTYALSSDRRLYSLHLESLPPLLPTSLPSNQHRPHTFTHCNTLVTVPTSSSR